MIKDILNGGIKLVRKNLKFIFLLWGTNIALSLVLIIPIYSMLLENLQHSLLSDELALNFNYFWYLQFRYLYENIFDKLPFLFYSIVGVNVLIQTFYAGGLISIFNNPKKNHVSDFFYGGVKYCYRFMKVALIVLFLFLIIFNVNDFIAFWISKLSENVNSVLLDLGIRSVRYVILLILIISIKIISDYIYVYVALNDITKIRKGIKQTIQFFRSRVILILSTFIIVTVIGLLGVIFYNLIIIYIPRSPFYFLILTFFLQQMLIIFRLSITMMFYATEVYLYKDQVAEVITN